MFGIGSPFHLYMMESEGMDDQISTRRAKILAAANEVRDEQLEYFNDIYAVVANHGIDMNTFTLAELDEFERKAGLK